MASSFAKGRAAHGHVDLVMTARLAITATFALMSPLMCACSFVTGDLEEVADTQSSTGGETTTGWTSYSTSDSGVTTSGDVGTADPAALDLGGDASTAGPTIGPCCRAHGGPGCTEPDVAACVCDIDRYCCEESWDTVCVHKVDAFGCGSCEGDATGSTGGSTTGGVGEPGSCCEATQAPGCTEPSIEECVCVHDDFCCKVEWDTVCVDLVFDAGCGPCPPPDDPGACCEADVVAGCADAAIETCVCDVMPSCCTEQWTSACADGVQAYQCGVCPSSGGDGPCCQDTGVPGCEDDAVAACVCQQDPYCCDVAWDGQCVGEVESLRCGSCDVDMGAGSTGA